MHAYKCRANDRKKDASGRKDNTYVDWIPRNCICTMLSSWNVRLAFISFFLDEKVGESPIYFSQEETFVARNLRGLVAFGVSTKVYYREKTHHSRNQENLFLPRKFLCVFDRETGSYKNIRTSFPAKICPHKECHIHLRIRLGDWYKNNGTSFPAKTFPHKECHIHLHKSFHWITYDTCETFSLANLAGKRFWLARSKFHCFVALTCVVIPLILPSHSNLQTDKPSC